MSLRWRLTVTSLKMFVRQREAIIWTLLLPVFMIVLFGLVDFDGIGKVRIGLAGSPAGLAEGLSEVEAVDLFRGTEQTELDLLLKGERDLVVVSSGSDDGSAGLKAYLNGAAPDEAQLAMVIVRHILDREALQASGGQPAVLTVERLEARARAYIDFLVPGVISLSIMQMGIFGVAFSFVSLKKRGILRRLSVTPLRPADFVSAQILMRLFVILVQITLLAGIGVFFLGVHVEGNLFDMFVLGVLGALVFLAIGFAIAGSSKSEDQVAPLSNIVAMPMILLSGVFFSRTGLPDIVHFITGFLPLTYLADGIRSIAIDGAGLGDVLPQVAGLLVWSVVATVGAIHFFRWE